MGNIDSGPECSRGPVDSLKNRLQSLEETIRSIEVAHQDAQGDHFPEPGAADVRLYGARLACAPHVQVLTGPVIGEVTSNSAVVLLEVDIAPGFGTTARVCCYLCLVEDACPRGRVVHCTALSFSSRRPRAFRMGGGVSDVIRPGRAYTVCFGGVCVEDARCCVGRFRTPSACFEPHLHVIAVSGDRPDRLAPGEPSLWCTLRERITNSSTVLNAFANAPGGEKLPQHRPIDVVLHTGGQAWMADAFEDAWELLRRRAMEPVLSADGGWREAQEEATERLREAVRRTWNLPDKRVVLSSVSNLMVCGAADLHPDFEDLLAAVDEVDGTDSSRRTKAGGKGGKQGFERKRQEARALHATVRACRHVFSEYQGQLLWKACSPGGGRGEEMEDLAIAFEAEEAAVERALVEARRIERDEIVKEKKVAIAEEALRRAKAAGSLPTEGGLLAVEGKMDNIRTEAKAARAKRIAFAKREVPHTAASAAKRASQGGFLNQGGSIAFALLDTAWVKVSWDGKIQQTSREREGIAVSGAASTAPRLLSPGAWATLELELSRDSELRLLIVVMRHPIVGGGVEDTAPDTGQSQSHVIANAISLGKDGHSPPKPSSTSSDAANDASGWRDEKDRLLDRLFAWKSGEAWREVVFVCGGEERRGGHGGLLSANELEILDRKHPGCTIRQMVAGPITGCPSMAPAVTPDVNVRDDHQEPPVNVGARFSYRCCQNVVRGGSEDGSDVDPHDNGIVPATRSAEKGTKQKRMTGMATPAPGWDDGEAPNSAGGTARDGNDRQALHASRSRSSRSGGAITSSEVINPPVRSAKVAAVPNPKTQQRRAKPVSAEGERSFLDLTLDGGHTPATAVAAGIDPAESVRGVTASVEAEAVTVAFVGATVVLGPVVGRVTQRSAVVLLEVGSTAAVGCVLTDGATGRRHRQVRLLFPGQPHAFFFENLEDNRYYIISLDGVDNADARTGAFTTLKSWPDRREPPVLRIVANLANGGKRSSETSRNDEDGPSAPCDVRLLFVSGTGLNGAPRQGRRPPGNDNDELDYPPGGDDENQDAEGGKTQSGVGATSTAIEWQATPAADMWGVLGRELWKPWPQADVVVHTGSQVDLEVAMMEAVPILSVAEAAEEGSEEREEAEEMAMERIRDAYRFQWSLPGARACLSCGSHLMLRGEADLGLPQLDSSRHLFDSSSSVPLSSSSSRGSHSRSDNRRAPASEKDLRESGGRFLRLQASAYVRLTLSRLASQAFSDYQRQLWDPLSVPIGLDINDVGYARGGAGIDSAGPGDGFMDANFGEEGEWHFHVFGETLGLFALDVRQGSAGLKRDERAPLLSDAQWSSLARALSIEEIQAMVIAGDAPFVLDSILDARTKARHASNAYLRRSWPFHGGELLRLVDMLVEWKTTKAVGGEPREVILIGGGLRHPLETVIEDSLTSIGITQTICGPFSGLPSFDRTAFEITGELSDRFSYRHTVGNACNKGTPTLHPDKASSAAVGSKLRNKGFSRSPSNNASSLKDGPDQESNIGNNVVIRDCDDLHRSPSCVLVRCEARGAGMNARLLLRSHLFTPASWAAWCEGGGTGTATAKASQDHPTGLPRTAPRWAAMAGGKGGGSSDGRRGGEARGTSNAAAEDIFAALSDEDEVVEVLAEAFERLLDVEEGEDEDEALAAARGGIGDATRRVFDVFTWVYDHVACASLRSLCPTRPSPVVIGRLLKASQGRRTKGNGKSEQEAPGDKGIEREEARGEARSVRNRGEGGERVKPATGLRRGAKEQGRERVPLLPSWLFGHLPFHDDESFALFFCKLLSESELLATSLYS